MADGGVEIDAFAPWKNGQMKIYVASYSQATLDLWGRLLPASIGVELVNLTASGAELKRRTDSWCDNQE